VCARARARARACVCVCREGRDNYLRHRATLKKQINDEAP